MFLDLHGDFSPIAQNFQSRTRWNVVKYNETTFLQTYVERQAYLSICLISWHLTHPPQQLWQEFLGEPVLKIRDPFAFNQAETPRSQELGANAGTHPIYKQHWTSVPSSLQLSNSPCFTIVKSNELAYK